ncbi:MAG TPA: cytochrome c oxidase assembly protein [Burkholderiales bacterium]
MTRAALSFYAGCAAAAGALLGPLHELAEERLWAHMVQHELLMVLAAPLLVLGRPLKMLVRALPARWRRFVRVPRLCSDAAFGSITHAAAVWLWHAPAFFAAALASPWLHFAQHASFFGSALLFWWSIAAPGRRHLAAIGALFATMVHTGVLGALMTFSRGSWYPGYELADQQLAGLVMWVPAGLVYPLAAVFLGAQWLSRSVRRAGASIRSD